MLLHSAKKRRKELQLLLGQHDQIQIHLYRHDLLYFLTPLRLTLRSSQLGVATAIAGTGDELSNVTDFFRPNEPAGLRR